MTVRTVSTLGYALLAQLARESLTGYDLSRSMREEVNFYWQAGHSQIYPELARLEVAGLVAHQRVEQPDRPSKKIFELTPAGREAVRAWATAPMGLTPGRDELVLKANAVWLADPAAAVALYQQQQQLHRERLDHYLAIEAAMQEKDAQALAEARSPQFATYATLRLGISYERHYADWCGWLADRLAAADAPRPSHPPATGSPAAPTAVAGPSR